MSEIQSKIIIGLADQQAGLRVDNILTHVTGSSSGVTIGASTSTLGFFGAAQTTRPVLVNSTTSTTAIITTLQNLGLVSNS